MEGMHNSFLHHPTSPSSNSRVVGSSSLFLDNLSRIRDLLEFIGHVKLVLVVVSEGIGVRRVAIHSLSQALWADTGANARVVFTSSVGSVT